MRSIDRNELLDQLCDTVEELTREVARLHARLEKIEGPERETTVRKKPLSPEVAFKDQKIPLGPVTLMPSPDDLGNDPRKW